MKDYSAKNIRNVGMFGHGGEGKTTITEAMLFNAGLLDRMGRVEDGNTTTDYDPEEAKRTISISASLAPFEWNGIKVNIIDSPGYFDFYGEVESAMALADSALIVVGAVSGPVVGTEKAMDMCKRYKKPRMIVVNQMDRENANFSKVLGELKEKFGTSIAPIQLPVIEGGVFKGFIDLIEMNAKMFDGKSVKITDIPAAFDEAAKEIRSGLIEAAAESDEELLEKFFMEEELTKEEILSGLSKGVHSASVTPVCCTSATLNLGITTLMDNIVSFMPAADAVPVKSAVDAKTGEPVEVKRDGKFAGQVMKTVADQFSGKISVIKVFAGVLSQDVSPYNSTAEKSEKPGTVYIMRGKNLINTDKLIAGDIGAMTKFQYTNTGDTLCDQSAPVKFEEIRFPKPNLSLALSAKKQGEEDKVFGGLNRMLEEDRTLSMEKNIETGDTIITGLGEMHLDVVCSKLKNKFKVEAELSEPKIPYRETIRSTAEAEGKHKKQSGGAGQFGVVQMRFEPLPGGDFEFVNAIVGGVVPKEFIPAVEKGTREAMRHGVLAGYPMTGIKATLYDGKYHPVDSKEVAFKSAARLSYKAACAKANPVLIEPIYRVTVVVPGDYMGDVIGDMNRRRGRVLGMNPSADGQQEVVAEVPLSELSRYATDLRSMTQARGSFDMEFVRYEDVPGNIAQKIIENAKKEEEEEE